MGIFDAIANFFSTSGKRWDGTSYTDSYRESAGYDALRKDFLPRNFGSEVRQGADGLYRGIASTEMVQGPDVLWRRKFGGPPRTDSHLR